MPTITSSTTKSGENSPGHRPTAWQISHSNPCLLVSLYPLARAQKAALGATSLLNPGVDIPLGVPKTSQGSTFIFLLIDFRLVKTKNMFCGIPPNVKESIHNRHLDALRTKMAPKTSTAPLWDGARDRILIRRYQLKVAKSNTLPHRFVWLLPASNLIIDTWSSSSRYRFFAH